MKSEDKKRLCDHLTGTAMPLAPAMMQLGIEEGLSIARAELADSIVSCRLCSKWTDVDVMENDLCPRCDAIANPENKPEA